MGSVLVALVLCLIALVLLTVVPVLADEYSLNHDCNSTYWEERPYISCNNMEKKAKILNESIRVRNTSECVCLCSTSNGSSSRLHPKVALATYSDSQHNTWREENRTLNFTGNVSCPPGFLLKANTSIQDETPCECREVSGILQCAKFGGLQKAFLRGGHCMTYNATLDKLSFGLCALSCLKEGALLNGLTNFYELSEDITQLNTLMCGEMNRQGFLCSECKPGFMPPAYSYSHKCVDCTISSNQLRLNWVKYIAALFIPQTVLFLLMLVFQVNVAVPPYSSLIQAFQAVTTPIMMQEFLRLVTCWEGPRANIYVYIALGLYGLFNLEFFRILIPSFCLKLDLLHLQYFEFLSASFPLILMCCTYILITLHTKNFKPVVLIWKPFHICLARLRREWSLKSSVIETFASFLILSWIKLLSISYGLLTPIRVYSYSTGNGSHINVETDITHPHYYPEVQMFTGQHLPLGILTLLVLLMLIIIPLLLLLLYPLRVFQCCLCWCGLRCQALHMFMDAFQGAFKNGTDGTKDYRSLASIHLLVRILLLALSTTLGNRFFFPIASLVLIAAAMIICAAQPYKKSFHNIFDAVLMLIMACFFGSVGAITIAEFATADGVFTLSIALALITALLPLVISICYLCWWICSKKLKDIQCQLRRSHNDINESLPDRIANPQDYIPYHDLTIEESRL